MSSPAQRAAWRKQKAESRARLAAARAEAEALLDATAKRELERQAQDAAEAEATERRRQQWRETKRRQRAVKAAIAGRSRRPRFVARLPHGFSQPHQWQLESRNWYECCGVCGRALEGAQGHEVSAETLLAPKVSA